MIRLLLISLLLIAAPAQAEPLNKAGLLSYCQGLYDVDAGFCAGYIQAVADVMQQQAIYGQSVCNLAPVQSQQLADLVKGDMQVGDPANNTVSAVQFTHDTLAKYYPCR